MEANRYTTPDPGGPGALASAHPAPALPEDEAQLAARFHGRLYLFAVRRLGDAGEAEDVAQEALRRVVEAMRAGRVRDAEALPAYAVATARHVCQQRLRSRGREDRALQRLHTMQDIPGAARGSDPLLALVSAERRTAVRAALLRLEEPDRELLRTLYYEELDIAQVAGRLGITEGAVRVRKHRALKRLRARLAGSEP